MPPTPITEYVARARQARRHRLAELEESGKSKGKGQDKDKNGHHVGRGDGDLGGNKSKTKKETASKKSELSKLSFILGLSWRLRGCTSDVDLVGGLDLRWLFALLLPPVNLAARFLGRGQQDHSRGSGTTTAIATAVGDTKAQRETQGSRALPPLRDALLTALPLHSTVPPPLPLSDPEDPYIPTLEGGRASSLRKRADFAALLSQVDRAAVGALCTQVLRDIRASGARRAGGSDSGSSISSPSYMAPPVVGDPILGSAHALWPVCFPGSDGGSGGDTRWMVKVPVCGTPDTWDAAGAEALQSEAAVLRLLGTLDNAGGDGDEDRFPAPRPIQAHTGVHNTLHAPYLIMEHIDGVRLDEYWFEGVDDGSNSANKGGHHPVYSAKHILHRRRRVLRSLASHLLKLSRFETDQGGVVVLDRNIAGMGGLGVVPTTAAPARMLDVQAMLDLWFNSDNGYSGTGDESNAQWKEERGPERTPMYTVVPPYKEPRDAYLSPLDGYPPQTEATRGVHELLRLLVGMLREPSELQGKEGDQHDNDTNDGQESEQEEGTESRSLRPFVLAHPDLQLRHVIVSDEGEVRGIVGWDGARSVPRSLGNEALPRWLVRDLNPFAYRWMPAVSTSAALGGAGVIRTAPPSQDNEAGAEGRGEGQEDPPWVLAELRQVYVTIIAGLKDKDTRKDGVEAPAAADTESGWHDELSSMLAREERKITAAFVTKQSLLALALEEACRDPRARNAILRQVLARCSRRFEPLDYGYLVEALGRGEEPDAYMMRCLRGNIREFVDKGFVKGASVW